MILSHFRFCVRRMGRSSLSASMHARTLEHDTPVISIWKVLNDTKSNSYKGIFLLLLLAVSSLKSTPLLLIVLIMLIFFTGFKQLCEPRLLAALIESVGNV